MKKGGCACFKVEGLHGEYGSVNILMGHRIYTGGGEIVAILGSNGWQDDHGEERSRECLSPSSDRWYLTGTYGEKEFPGDLKQRHRAGAGGTATFTDMTVLENLQMGAFNKETKAISRKT